MKHNTAKTTEPAWHPLQALAAWFVPGLGHYLLGLRKRGSIIAISIGSLYLAGLLIGGISVIDSKHNKLGYAAQVLIAPTPVIDQLHQHMKTVDADPATPQIDPAFEPSFGRVHEQGLLYTAMAGLLNLLAILDVVYRRPEPDQAAEPVAAPDPAGS